jgi:4-amino-4-deoxy-L-arabinose transferase-like glycosyltransferase
MDEIPKAPWALTPEALAKVQQPVPEPPEPVREEVPREPVVDLRRTTLHNLLIAAALGVVAVAAVMLTYRGIGYSWDEAYYRAPAQMTVEWLGAFSSERAWAVSPEAINRYWRGERNIGVSELPSVVKWAMGLSWMMTHDWWGDQRALRFPAALAFGISVFFVYLLTLNSYRRRAAVIAACAFMTMPCVFGHAHVGATETIANAALLATIYCFFRGLKSAWWAIVFGVAYGIALDTKINAVLLAPVLLMWGHAFHRRSYVNNFFAMVFVAPLVWIALWPWLWHDTTARLLDYFRFFTGHQDTAVWYLGEKWGFGNPGAPWHYPIIMTLVTVPVPILVFSIVGLARTAVHCRWEYRGILFTAYAVVVLLYASLPGSPKYDSTRLFFSLFPMLAILTGGGADSLVGIFPFDRKIRGWLSVRHVVAAVFFAIIAGNGLWAIVKIHPHELSYFNVLTGGLEGAQDRFETSYWGESLNEDVIAYLNTLPSGAHVRPMAMHELSLIHLQKWGVLRDDLRFDTGGAFKSYDYFLLQVRKGFFGPIEQYLFDRPAEKVFSFRGVPFFCLYSRKEAGELANQ